MNCNTTHYRANSSSVPGDPTGERRLPADDPKLARLYRVQADVLYPLGDVDGAAEAYRKAVAIYAQLGDPVAYAQMLYNYADVFIDSDRCERAVPLLQQAVAVARDGHVAGVASRARAASGTCLAKLGRDREADAEMTAAIAELDQLGDTVSAADVRWQLADVRWRLGHHPEAIALATAARDGLNPDDVVEASIRDAAIEWLAAHPRP